MPQQKQQFCSRKQPYISPRLHRFTRQNIRLHNSLTATRFKKQYRFWPKTASISAENQCNLCRKLMQSFAKINAFALDEHKTSLQKMCKEYMRTAGRLSRRCVFARRCLVFDLRGAARTQHLLSLPTLPRRGTLRPRVFVFCKLLTSTPQKPKAGRPHIGSLPALRKVAEAEPRLYGEKGVSIRTPRRWRDA